MKLFCGWYERALSRLAVEGQPLPVASRLAAHVGVCPDCRHAWEEFTLLTAELPIALSEAYAPHPLCAPVLPTRSPQRGATRLSLSALAVTGLLLAAFAGGRFAPEPTAPAAAVTFRQAPLLSHAQSPRLTTRVEKDRLPVTGSPTLAQSKPLRRLAGSAPETALPVSDLACEYAPLTRAERSEAEAEAATPEDWGGLGAWYAANGEYACAADAYARAYESKPDPDFALAAGENAECAGDMNEALNYYLHVLETSPKPPLHPEEDEPWNENPLLLSWEPCSF